MSNATHPWPSYSAMVKSLFKQMPGPYGTIMHAAIGIAGETGEIADSVSYSDTIKECGDLEFYIEAMWQAIGVESRPRFLEEDAFSFVDYTPILHVLGSQILDLAKKSWVYEKEFDTVKMMTYLEEIGVVLCAFYRAIGTDLDMVQQTNMEKLALRYQAGTYSNEAAVAQVDKAITGEKEGKNAEDLEEAAFRTNPGEVRHHGV